MHNVRSILTRLNYVTIHEFFRENDRWDAIKKKKKNVRQKTYSKKKKRDMYIHVEALNFNYSQVTIRFIISTRLSELWIIIRWGTIDTLDEEDDLVIVRSITHRNDQVSLLIMQIVPRVSFAVTLYPLYECSYGAYFEINICIL